MSDILKQPIEHLDISIRTFNALKGDNILTVGQLIGYSRNYLLRTPRIGRKTVAEIERVLANVGLILKKDEWKQK